MHWAPELEHFDSQFTLNIVYSRPAVMHQKKGIKGGVGRWHISFPSSLIFVDIRLQQWWFYPENLGGTAPARDLLLHL